jgi:hypothetical protein
MPATPRILEKRCKNDDSKCAAKSIRREQLKFRSLCDATVCQGQKRVQYASRGQLARGAAWVLNGRAP